MKDANRYTLYTTFDNIVDESSNKAKLIAKARKMKEAATVTDNKCGGIIFENKIQRKINNS